MKRLIEIILVFEPWASSKFKVSTSLQGTRGKMNKQQWSSKVTSSGEEKRQTQAIIVYPRRYAKCYGRAWSVGWKTRPWFN